MPSTDVDYSGLDIGGFAGADGGGLGNANGRTPGGYAVSIGGDIASEAASTDIRRVLGINGDGTAYFAGSGGFTFRGLQTDTNYPVLAKPDWLNPAGGLSYTFDSENKPFWRDNLTGEVMSPVAPYALPTRVELETQALLSGARESAISLASNVWNGVRTAGGMYFGDTESWKLGFAAANEMRTQMARETLIYSPGTGSGRGPDLRQ